MTDPTWEYKGRLITDISDMPEGTFGFIYRITHIPSNKKYIGKKVLYNNRKKPLTKAEIAEQTGPGRKPTHKIVTTESDWKKYWGSNKEFQKLTKIHPATEFSKEIIEFAPGKKLLTYYECKYLFAMGVLEDPQMYANDNILGKFYTKDFLVGDNK